MRKFPLLVGCAVTGYVLYGILIAPSPQNEAASGGSGLSSETSTRASRRTPSSGPAGFVADTLRDHRVVVFSKSYCGFSRRAKEVMARHLGAGGFKIVELDERPDGAAIQDHMMELTGGRTVPRVFVDSKFIGGSDDVSALDASGKLGAMLREKGLTRARRFWFF